MEDITEKVEGCYPIDVFEKARLRNQGDRQFLEVELNQDRNVHAIVGSVLDEGEELEIVWDCDGIASMGKYPIPEFDLIIPQAHESIH